MDISYAVVAIFLTFIGVVIIRVFSNLDIDTARMWADHNKSTNADLPISEPSGIPDPIMTDIPQPDDQTNHMNYMNYHTPQWWKHHMDRLAVEREQHLAEKAAVMSN